MFAAEDAADEMPISLPGAITTTLAQAPQHAEFPMIGAEVFARACREEGLAALFCCPGNYTVINAIAAEGIPTYGGRTEGSMCAAADGFIRVTGEIAACSGTEGILVLFFGHDYPPSPMPKRSFASLNPSLSPITGGFGVSLISRQLAQKLIANIDTYRSKQLQGWNCRCMSKCN